MWGTDLSELSNRSIGYGIIPNPFVPGDSVEDSKRTCSPMHIPKYGFPDRMYSRRGSRRPRERRCSIAVWNAPTPGKIRICGGPVYRYSDPQTGETGRSILTVAL